MDRRELTEIFQASEQDDAWNDERSDDKELVKSHVRLNWLCTALRFKQFAHKHACLRSSAFLIAKFPKDMRATQLSDRGCYDSSVISGDGIYSSLHVRRQNYNDAKLKTSPTTTCWLIPRFRCVVPVLAMVPVQILLWFMYGMLTGGFQWDDSSRSVLCESKWADKTVDALIAILVVQIAISVFIAVPNESGLLTRVMRIPRFCAIAMMPLNLWMLYNVVIGPGQLAGLKSWGLIPEQWIDDLAVKLDLLNGDTNLLAFGSLCFGCLLIMVMLTYVWTRSAGRDMLQDLPSDARKELKRWQRLVFKRWDRGCLLFVLLVVMLVPPCLTLTRVCGFWAWLGIEWPRLVLIVPMLIAVMWCMHRKNHKKTLGQGPFLLACVSLFFYGVVSEYYSVFMPFAASMMLAAVLGDWLAGPRYKTS